MALILEVLDARTREVRARVGLGALPLAVGRGLDNDLVLDDPYVDGRHARIVQGEGGSLVMEDLGSLNGLIASGAPDRAARIMLHPWTEVRVGRTTLRVRDPAEPVPPALPDFSTRRAAVAWGTGWLTNLWARLAIVVAATVAVAAYTWSESYDRQMASDVFGGAVAFLLLTATWAGVWAVAGRIVVHRFRFPEHVVTISASVLAFLAVLAASEWTAFFFPDNAVAAPLEGVIALGVIAALIAQHLALASNMPRGRCWAAGLTACGVLVVLAGIGALVDRESFSDVPEFSGVLKPVHATWIPAGSPGDLERVAADLKAQVDELAR